MKLLLIDGYSLLFRAYFSSPPLTTKEGQPTGALFGFLKMVLRLLDEARPDYALVALDAHAPTFRHDADATYKANRPEASDDMKTQALRVRPVLAGLSIPYYEHAGFEADDIIGTLAAHGPCQGCEVTIVTGDGDALQLVTDRVRVLLTRKGVSDLQQYSPDGVRERFGFDPLLLPDYKGLRGDASDNIPGVPGIGEKTASSLISQWGALENVYQHLDEVKPPRIANLLREHEEAAFHSRQMARIVTDLPVTMDFEACRYVDPRTDAEKRERALKTIQELEFKSLLSRFQDGAAAEDADKAEEKIEAFACEWKEAKDAAEALQWLQKESKPVAVWWENDALAFGSEAGALTFAGAPAELRNWLEDAKAPKIAHDAKTLRLMLGELEVSACGIEEDTFLMAYLLDPAHQVHPLPKLAGKYLQQALPEPPTAPKPEKKAKKAVPTSLFEDDQAQNEQENQAALLMLERHKVSGAYACAMTRLVPVLREALKAIGELQILDELELPLVDVLVSMERCGMQLDVAHLEKVGEHLKSETERLQGEIWQAAGEEFNVGSTKQLQVVLFEKLGLAKGRSIKTGFSTDVHTLEKLAEEHEIVRKILDYRGTTKLQATYVEALLNGRDKKTNRIHTSLNQTGTITGRISSSNPNLQNVPIRTQQGRLIRQAFIAPPGHVLMKADYSQIELRILAHITGDLPLVEAFQTGQDVHSRTASELFDIPVDKVDAEMRRKAKMTNYAIAYGVSGFGLAKQLGGGSPGEAQKFINRYFETLPGIKKYIDDTLETARKQGYVETLLGRRRPLPEINSPRGPERAGAERTAINHPIQGTSADIMKIAMLAVFDEMRRRKVKSRLIMQVHDELVFEVPHDEVPEMAELARSLMSEVPTQRLELRVPLETDVGVGPNWDETEKIAG
jgi:DNA polymerase-1